MLKILKGTAAALPLLVAVPAFAQDAPEEISTAVEAATTAGVVETLLAGGEVTVFVPTNDAIAAAPQDALSGLLENPEELASVIQGYAIEGAVMASDVMGMESGSTVSTLGGGELMIMVDGETVMVGPSEDAMATVVTPDLQLGNVTIHIIDTAFLPSTEM